MTHTLCQEVGNGHPLKHFLTDRKCTILFISSAGRGTKAPIIDHPPEVWGIYYFVCFHISPCSSTGVGRDFWLMLMSGCCCLSKIAHLHLSPYQDKSEFTIKMNTASWLVMLRDIFTANRSIEEQASINVEWCCHSNSPQVQGQASISPLQCSVSVLGIYSLNTKLWKISSLILTLQIFLKGGFHLAQGYLALHWSRRGSNPQPSD